MSLEDLREYCKRYADLIYVREQIDGKWASYSLSEMPAEMVERHIRRWFLEGHVPHRLLTMEEQKIRNTRGNL